MNKDLINLILDDREKRYDLTVEMAEKYNLPVLCGKINYPGEDKNTFEAGKAFKILRKAVEERFNGYSVEVKEIKGYDGKAIIMPVNLTDRHAKEIAVSIEETHPLGRLFDIDIYGLDGVPLSRSDIGMEGRKCIVCGKDARVCAKSREHSIEETLNIINEIINIGFR